MWVNWDSAPHQHYFIKELSQLSSGTYVIPLRWVTVSGEAHFQGYEVKYLEDVSTSCFLLVAVELDGEI